MKSIDIALVPQYSIDIPKSMSNDLSAYKNLYLETAKVYLQTMKEDVLRLKTNTQDKYAISDMYISAHSLKSQSSVMKYSQISVASKMIEQIFHDIKEYNKPITEKLLHALDITLQEMQTALGSIEQSNEETNLAKEIKSLESKSF